MLRMSIAVKCSTYLRGPTPKGTTACTKRGVEVAKPRVCPKLLINMGRLTNPYNFTAGSEVPISLSVRNYVVFLTFDKFKEPTASSLTKGSPKLIV